MQEDRNTDARFTTMFDLSPELIDDGSQTSPSKRIVAEIPEYDGMKVSAGPIVAERIGLPTLRAKCKHFNAWLDQIGSLSDSSSTSML